MKLHILAAVLFLLAFGTMFSPAFAQQNEDKEDAMLPDIDPQNITIRGEFKAQFPGLQRQPILGFDPSMRIYQIPPEREPFMESGTDVLADLPISEFARPDPPAYTPFTYSDVNYLFSRIGIGSYSSPMVQFWGAFPLSDQTYIGADIDYSASTEGHLAERPSGYRYFTANAELGTQLNENMDLYVYAGIQNDFNYSARFGPPENVENIARIEFEGMHAGAALTHYKNEVTGWKLEANFRSFTSAFKSEFRPGKIEEEVYSGSFSYRWTLGHPGETITLKAGGRGGMYWPEDTEMQQWSTFYGGIAYERLFNYNTRLHAEGYLYYISNFVKTQYYPGGLASLSHWFGNRIKISGTVEARPTLQTVEQLHEENRFLGYKNKLRHTYAIRVNGEASIKFYRGSRLYGGVTYLNAQNYSYYLPRPSGAVGVNYDYYTVNYSDATNMKLYAGITHQLVPETFWLSATAYLQNPMLTSGEPIPYKSNWGLNTSATYRPVDRVTIQGWANYVADREPAIADTELENIFLVGGN